MYVSTRGSKQKLSASEAIIRGIASDGGLFVPIDIPTFDSGEIAMMGSYNYKQRAYEILSKFLPDYGSEELKSCIEQAYSFPKFDTADVAPLVEVGDNYVLELWHGPTSAFKDMALQLLPLLMSVAAKNTDQKEEIVILVATSGDTGKAALEGFKDVDKIKIIVFYPCEGVSEIQRLQMVTQEGNNVAVVAVEGNFDDAQTGVKNIFNDVEFNNLLDSLGYKLSSANSINWGRLVPQIVYYFSAYADMIKNGHITMGSKVNFVVPTGNFGNILAGYYAKLMGLPINRLICASNHNNVLTEFINTGVYNRNRKFHKTLSPSMDILISSNLERLLYHITKGDSESVSRWMRELSQTGCYNVSEEHLKDIQQIFWAGWIDDERTVDTIGKVYDSYGYVADPHTAVAWRVSEMYKAETQDGTPTIIVSTASPFKFNESVLKAIKRTEAIRYDNEFDILNDLAATTGWKVPGALKELRNKPVVHKHICSKTKMKEMVQDILASQK